MAKLTIVSDLRARLDGPLTDEQSEKLDLALSYESPGAKYAWKSKARWMKSWDGRVHLLTDAGQTFPSGLLPLAQEALEGMGVGVEVVDERKRVLEPPRGPTGVSLRDPRDPTKLLTLRDYQLAALEGAWKGFKAGEVTLKRGIIRVPTGGGKTEITAALAQMFGSKGRTARTLVLLHKKKLAHQTQERLAAELGEPVGLIGDGEWNEKQVTVVILATLMHPARKAKATVTLQGAELLVIDECHHASSTSWYKLVKNCRAPYRFGLSGTPLDRSDGKDMLLVASTGPMLYSIRSKTLQEQGHLATATVHFREIHEPRDIANLDYHGAYTEGVVQNEHFHDQVVTDATKLVEAGDSTLIIVRRIQHGHLLDAAFWKAENPITHEFVHGEMDQGLINDAVKRFEAGELKVLIASPIFGEGIDIPGVHALIIADGGKSVIDTIQKAGRALRPKKGRPNTVNLIDYANFTNRYLTNHSIKRLEIYKEQGFKIL